MGRIKNSIKQQNTEASRENSSGKNSLNTVVAIVGAIAAFLAGSYIFYQIGKDSCSNNCEGEKIILQNKIDSLKKEQLSLQTKFSQADKNMQNCIDKNDSIINENNRLNRLITETKYINNVKIAGLIKTGKTLLLNTKIIQDWQNECIAFLEKNYKNQVANFKKETAYTPSEVGKRSIAIENGIRILKKLN